MCAQLPNVSDAPSTHNSYENGNSGGFDEALKNLAEAIAERKVEPICTAYLALRHVAGKTPLIEILKQVDRTVSSKSGSALAMIISAFSHRQCVMCSSGAAPCRTCSGSGTSEGFECPTCDGLGVETCSFCAGTGWSDRHDIPDEIRPAAVNRRIKHAKKELARLDRISEADIPASVKQLQPQQQSELASSLLRLQARLTSLAGVEVGNDAEHIARFRVGAERIRRFLEVLRAKHPQAQE